LATALAAAQKLYGASFNPEITLKALSYFGDGNLPALPEDMTWSAFQTSSGSSGKRTRTMDCRQ
jgi:hypothetical protein